MDQVGDDITLDSRAGVPSDVVYREFAAETVVLNLATGKYHGLNRTAAQILESLDAAATLGETAAKLADEHGISREEVERDVLDLCRELQGRGLLEVRPATG